MNPQDVLQRLEALDQAATPGPWEWVGEAMVGDAILPGDDGLWPDEYAEDGAEDVEGGFRRRIIATDSGYYPPREADRALIAAARNSLGALVAVARAVQQQVDDCQFCGATGWTSTGGGLGPDRACSECGWMRTALAALGEEARHG